MTMPLAVLLTCLVPTSPTPPMPAAPAPPLCGSARHDIRSGPGVTRLGRLSDYLPSLAGTAGDTSVYVLEGSSPGGVALVVGGTHGNEIAGIVAATVLAEYARVERGRLIVVPHANNSAILGRDPDRPGPPTVTIETPGGPRTLRYGARRTLPQHQGRPDPPEFRHPHAAEALDGREARNLDRAYPGRADGNLTERIAAAIMTLLARERVDVAFDLHEAAPGSRLAWMLVAHPKSLDLAAAAVVELDAVGISMKLEHSSDTFRGLSHREWGDATPAQTFLIETPNPAQREGAEDVDVVGDAELPLGRRVAVHLATVSAVLEAFNGATTLDRTVRLARVPSPDGIARQGIGAFLRPGTNPS